MKYENLHDVIPTGKFSACCDAAVYAPTDEWALCLNCHEYCDTYETDED